MSEAPRTHPDMWVDPGNDPRDSGPDYQRGERDVVLDYLRVYRLTFAMKCEGLDAEQLARRSVPPSTLSLLGLLRHLAKVEQVWFREVIEAQDVRRHFASAGDRDADFNGAVGDSAVVDEAWATWRTEVAHAEAVMAPGVSFDTVVEHHGTPIEVRDVIVHLVEEYARHCGHADLLREAIDGRTGQ